MLRPLFLLAFCWFSVHAHSGFDTLAWREPLGAYALSVLEDFHADAGQAQLVVQLSQGKAAPATTRVNALIRLNDEVIYEGKVPFAANGSEDGKTFYRSC